MSAVAVLSLTGAIGALTTVLVVMGLAGAVLMRMPAFSTPQLDARRVSTYVSMRSSICASWGPHSGCGVPGPA